MHHGFCLRLRDHEDVSPRDARRFKVDRSQPLQDPRRHQSLVPSTAEPLSPTSTRWRTP